MSKPNSQRFGKISVELNGPGHYKVLYGPMFGFSLSLGRWRDTGEGNKWKHHFVYEKDLLSMTQRRVEISSTGRPYRIEGPANRIFAQAWYEDDGVKIELEDGTGRKYPVTGYEIQDALDVIELLRKYFIDTSTETEDGVVRADDPALNEEEGNGDEAEEASAQTVS